MKKEIPLILVVLVIITVMNIPTDLSTEDQNTIAVNKLSKELKYLLSSQSPNIPLVKGRVPVIIELKGAFIPYKILKIKEDTYYSLQNAESWNSIEKLLDNMRRKIKNYFRSVYEEKFQQIEQIISSGDGIFGYRLYTIGAVSALVWPDQLDDLAQLHIVKRISLDHIFRIQLNIAAKAIHADIWWNEGYTGSNYLNDSVAGIEVAVLDTGVYMEHPALAGKVIDYRNFSDDANASDLNGHGTAVAGVIASQSDTYRGIAYGANIINAKCMNADGNGYESWIMAAAEWAITEANDTAEIINTSLGDNESPYDGNTTMTRFVDAVTDYYDVIWVTAAGNYPPGNPEDNRINVPGDAFNVITVGAMNDQNTEVRSDDSLAGFSCTGPTQDGRIKPDITAPGYAIYTTTKDGGFANEYGTSFATPVVSGAAALIYPYLIENISYEISSLMKALLINSADDWGYLGADNETGWGYINLANAWNQRNYLRQNKLESDAHDYYSINLNEGDKLRITLVWNRRTSSSSAAIFAGSANFYKLSDLSLRIYLPNGTLYKVSDSAVDNVEHIYINYAPASGIYILDVYNKESDASIDAMGGEIYSLVASKPLLDGVVAIPLRLAVSSENEVLDSESFFAQVNVTNKGNTTIEDISVNITLPEGVILVNSSRYYHIDSLEANESAAITFKLRPYSIGTYKIRAFAVYTQEDMFLKIDNSTEVTIIDDDSDGPDITFNMPQKSLIAFFSVSIEVTVEDPSGIKTVILYYRLGNPTISDYSYDGKITMVLDPNTGKYIASISINPLWHGKSLYIKFKAIDNDNDRPNDEAITWSESINLGSVSALPIAMIGGIIVAAIVVAYLIIRKR